MLRALILIPFLLLAACVTSPSYTYYHGDGPDDARYSDATAVDGDYYYGNAMPAYLAYPAYFDVLWPVYSNYYDPFFTPGFHYGVTFFPSYYRGFGGRWSGWGPGLAFSPWRHAYWDSAYDWSYWYRNQQYRQYERYQHFGSARNQQVARAGMTDQSRRYPGPPATNRTVRGEGVVPGPRRFARGQDGVPPDARQRPARPAAPARSGVPTRQAVVPSRAPAPAMREAPARATSAPRMAAPAPMSRAPAPASAAAMSRPSVGAPRSSASGRRGDR